MAGFARTRFELLNLNTIIINNNACGKESQALLLSVIISF